MDTTALIAPTTEEKKSSRLPAGSTLKLANGIEIPHPHAEVNLPGKGDPRLGDTEAVTEHRTQERQIVDGESVIVPVLRQDPLHDSAKAHVVTAV